MLFLLDIVSEFVDKIPVLSTKLDCPEFFVLSPGLLHTWRQINFVHTLLLTSTTGLSVFGPDLLFFDIISAEALHQGGPAVKQCVKLSVKSFGVDPLLLCD